MRREDPLFYYQPLDIFVLTGYRDMRDAARRPDLFSSTSGVILTQLMYPPDPDGGWIGDEFIDPEGELFSFTDPPRHRVLRKVLSAAFAPRAVGLLTERIHDSARNLVRSIRPGEVVDFVDAVASELPLVVAANLLGVPEEYTPDIRSWSDALEMLGSGAMTPEELRGVAAVYRQMKDFLREQFAIKRRTPGEDLLSALLVEDLDGAPLSEARLLTYCHQVLAVGSDTTRSMLSTFALALAQNPEERARLTANRDLMPTAVEEGLRLASPGRGFVRTATEDTTIAGREIRRGQHVYLLYGAGNYDPEIFPDPFQFDVARDQEMQNMAFGFGPHVCIASHLVRSEASLLFNELLDVYPDFRLAAPAVPVLHVLRNG